MTGLIAVLVGAGSFVFVTALLAVLIWTLAPSSTDAESRVIAEMLHTRYELDLLACEARERIAQVRSRSH